MPLPARALALSVLLLACGSTEAPIDAASTDESTEAAGVLPPASGAGGEGEPAPAPETAPDRALDPPCDRARCAERPIIFIHGFGGSNDDWEPLMKALVAEDGRWTGYQLSGVADHAWAPRSIPRSRWLFAFDYYLLTGKDGRGKYTAGPGRIGSNGAFPCPAGGKGYLRAEAPSYDEGFTHEYAADLARYVDDVLRATGAEKVDLAGHSMGGLVSRSYLSFHEGASKVERLLLAASPIEGIPLASVGGAFGVGEPWMKDREMVEIDSGSIVANPKFSPCGVDAVGTWPSQLTLLERRTALPDVIAVTGTRDLFISYERGHHAQTRLHVIADGADHARVPQAKETIALTRQELGGDTSDR